MFLSRFIVNAYETLIEITLWGSLALFVLGFGMSGAGSGIVGFIIGMLLGGFLWLILAPLFFGVFLVVVDIRNRLKDLQAMK